jgi:hypothetical protein
MDRYIKIHKKNDAGWFRLIRQASGNVPGGDSMIKPASPGFFQIPSDQASSPFLSLLSLPNPADNILQCTMERWRDPSGNPIGMPDSVHPRGRRYFWQIEFEIIMINLSGQEQNLTPLYTATGNWFGDTFGLPIILNQNLSPQDQVLNNVANYNEWISHRNKNTFEIDLESTNLIVSSD